jgi:hypothetical protein
MRRLAPEIGLIRGHELDDPGHLLLEAALLEEMTEVVLGPGEPEGSDPRAEPRLDHGVLRGGKVDAGLAVDHVPEAFGQALRRLNNRVGFKTARL